MFVFVIVIWISNVWYGCLIFVRIKFSWISLGFLSMIIYEVLYTWCLRLRGRYSLLKIIFGGVIIVLANKSITTRSFSLLSVSMMISSLNDYWKPLLNRVGSLSLSKFITRAMKWPTSLFIKKVNSQPGPANFGY